MTLPVVFTANGQTGYNLTKSLRLRRSASAYLNRTFSSPTSGTKWTISYWAKLGLLGRNNHFAPNLSTNEGSISIESDYKLYINARVGTVGGAGTNYVLSTTQVFRDPSAWYHIVYALDTTQATASNRVKLYINGTQVTAFDTANYPPQNSTPIMGSAVSHAIGRVGESGYEYYYDGLFGEMNYVDGQALTPSSFGSTNSLTGVWQPAKYTGSYGTNGFYLPFTDVATTSGSNAGLGKDFSGNGNYWNTNNISVTAGSTYDSMNDVPTLTSTTTANYCVLNPISSGGTITNGNLSTSNNDTTTYGTVAITTGKFYWEYTITACSGGAAIALGVSKDTNRATGGTWGANDVFLYQSGGNKYGNGTSGAYGSSYTTNDVIGVALDMTGYTLTFYKNNVSQGTAFSSTQISPYTLIPMFYGYPSGNSTNVNFGQQSFTYTPPTGFVALNTFNLPTSTIVQGNTVMNVTTYTGNGSTQSITNAGTTKPDLVWVKSRSSATYNELYDSVRGVSKRLFSNDTAAEADFSPYGVTAFNSNGFTVNDVTSSGYGVNESGVSYIGWQWQAGQGSSSSNTDGSITTTVSKNTSAGFSIVTWAGTGAGGTIGHGLGVTPSMVIIKNRTSSQYWFVNQISFSATLNLYLNTTDSPASDGVFTSRSSTTIGIGGNVSASSTNYVAYCWAAIAGYSAFGGYTGNGSTDGPFIYTGFRPKFVMIKRTDYIGDWTIVDTSRNPYNYEGLVLAANTADAETSNTYYTGGVLDGLSNGFKIRNGSGPTNPAGGTCMYMAFAENPFKNALAR